MKKEKILLKNASLITETGEIRSGQDLVIRDGIIQSVNSGKEESIHQSGVTEMPEAREIPEGLEDREKALAGPEPNAYDRVIDCSGYYVTPGLTNLHCHCAMNLFKGIAEDVSADAWFNEKIWPYESKLEPEDVYVGTKLGIAEMLNCGVTAFADHYFEEEAVLQAALELGIRMDLAPTIFGSAPDFPQRLRQVSDFCEKNRGRSGRISLRMGPHAPYTCPPAALGEITERARELGLGLHLHVSETKEQVEESRKTYGKTPFAMAAQSGIFDLPVLVAHGLWIEEEDFALLGEDTWFGFCPKTYARFSMGTGLAFGNRNRLNYSFGTDGAASSNTLNPCEQARYFAQLGKWDGGDPCDYGTLEVWRALMRGHQAFSFGSGSLTPGSPADLVIWDLKKPNTWPVYHPVTSILYSSEPSNVLYTMVDGVFLKENGRLVLDEEALMEEGFEAQKRVLERGQGEAKVLYFR